MEFLDRACSCKTAVGYTYSYQYPRQNKQQQTTDMALAMFTHQTNNSIPHGMEITVRVLVSKTTATTIIMLAL